MKVGGLKADGVRRPPTANGMSFIRLEDPAGMLDVIISPAVYAACREALHSAFLVVEGKLQKGPTMAIVAEWVSHLE